MPDLGRKASRNAAAIVGDFFQRAAFQTNRRPIDTETRARWYWEVLPCVRPACLFEDFSASSGAAMERQASFGRGYSRRRVARVLLASAKHGRFGPASSNPSAPAPRCCRAEPYRRQKRPDRQLAVVSAITVVAPTMAPGVSLSFIFCNSTAQPPFSPSLRTEAGRTKSAGLPSHMPIVWMSRTECQ